jgi:hypothetical protein
LYRAVVAISALVVFVAAGAWLAVTLPVQFLAGTGAGIGAGIGVVVALLLLHDFSHRSRLHPRRVDVRTHRRR